MGSELAFIRPLALLLLIPAIALFIGLRNRHASAGWHQAITPDKLRWLILPQQRNRYSLWSWLLAAVLAITALAGPSWQTLPEASLKNRHGMVIAFDLSDSMLAFDLTPSRLVRARLKLIDLLNERRDGETALIAYAAQAYQVAPLTDDPKTIISLVPTLHPDIMPAPGSHTEAAVSLAIKTLRDAGLENGDIVLFTDGVNANAQSTIIAQTPTGFRVSVLATGSTAPVQIPSANGGVLRDSQGEPITQTMDTRSLQALSNALGGVFTTITNDATDITTLTTLNQSTHLVSATDHASPYDIRRDGGWLLALLLMPWVLSLFRRNVLWCLVLLLPVSEPTFAVDFGSWWRNADQQATRALREKDAVRAATLFKNPSWSLVAKYRAGQFAAAANTVIPNATPDDWYNRANALAMTGALPDAIKLYDRVLQLVPNHADAKFNRELADQTWQRIQQERAAQRDRQKRLMGNETEPSDTGEEQAPPGPASQANQVGGESSDGQSNEQGALNDQGASASERNDTPSDSAKQANPPIKPRNEAARKDAQTAQSASATLNPYAEQWLRNLKDDPGALMRRKFQFQANQRAREIGPPERERRY